MKKTVVLLLIAALALCAAACAKPQSAQLANPVVGVDSAAAFEALDLYIDAPEGAEDVTYSTISDAIAQVTFTLDGRKYTYRAAHTEEDITGVYETFDEKEQGIQIDDNGFTAAIAIRTLDGMKKGAVALWAYDTAHFSLYTPDAVDIVTLGELLYPLAKAQYSHYN